MPYDVNAFKKMFPDEPLTGPAHLIYQQLLMTRTGDKRCALRLKHALDEMFSTAPPPDAPPVVVPPQLATEVTVETVMVPAPQGDVRTLVYRPRPGHHPHKTPVLLYFHGGGWSLGSADEAEALCRKLAWMVPITVVSVDYRLAPEHPYPAGLDDCVAAYVWLRERGAEMLGADPERVAVGGDSCGGNLAPALTLRMKDEGYRVPDADLLLCPGTDFRFEEYPSFRKLAWRGLLYDMAFLGAVRGGYVPYELWDHPYVSPTNADLNGFPPTHIVTASADPLWDENHAFADKLRAVGVDVEVAEYVDMPHAFYYFLGLTREEEVCYGAMAAFLRRVLAIPVP